jgi:ribosome-binding protein aMBF1 (putative translation factor)
LVPVVLHRKKTKQETLRSGDYITVARQTPPNSHNTSIMSAKTANDFDPENISRPVSSSHDLASAIRDARVAKTNADGQSMTQSDLDKACQFAKGTVRGYENGTAVYNAEQVNEMARTLGVKLPRPSKKRSI